MLLEHRTVSRKPSGDGRLEITKAAAVTCGGLDLDLDSVEKTIRVVSSE